jgi:hypothetical protein
MKTYTVTLPEEFMNVILRSLAAEIDRMQAEAVRWEREGFDDLAIQYLHERKRVIRVEDLIESRLKSKA